MTGGGVWSATGFAELVEKWVKSIRRACRLNKLQMRSPFVDVGFDADARDKRKHCVVPDSEEMS